MPGRRGPDDIRWLDAGAAPRALGCPVCGDAGPHAPRLVVRTMAEADDQLTLMLCRACGSGFYDPPGVVDFAELGHAGVAFWRFYVEVGGGVWETIWPILAVRGPPGRSLLDIGCGFGFAVDFWGRETGGEAIGVELADYGRIGARHLGVVVHDRLLQDIRELDGRRFDVVYASEVIEHVPDPGAFVALLARYVADDGVLVLTTPAIAYVTRHNHSPTLHAALAPGFHGFLLSAESFASAAKRAGFAHVDVRTFGERQILWASQRPLDVDVAMSRMMPAYVTYLDRRLAEGDPASPVWQGLAYRAVKERVNGGRPAEARPLAARLLDAMAASFGDAVRDPKALARRIAEAGDMTALGEVMPFFAPNLYYYLGMIALQADRDAAAGVRWFEGSVACTMQAVRIHATLFLEATSLAWPARAAIAEVAIALGDVARGAEALATMCREGDASTPAHGYARATLDQIELRAPATAAMLAERGRAAEARTIGAGHAEHVTRRYGADLLTVEGVERALAARSAMPADPMFAPWLAAMLDLAERRPGADARAEAVASAAERLAPQAAQPARMRAQAASLRQRLRATSAAGAARP